MIPTPIYPPRPPLMLSLTSMHCCGLHELFALGHLSPEQYRPALFRYLAEQRGKVYCAYIVFTAVVHRAKHYGETFKDFILKEGLGAVTAAPMAVNPNSSNTLQPYIWTLDQSAIKDWFDREAKEYAQPLNPKVEAKP